MNSDFYENVRWFENREEFRIWVLEGGLRKPYRPHTITIILKRQLEVWKIEPQPMSSLYFCGSYSSEEELENALLFIIPAPTGEDERDLNLVFGISRLTGPEEFIFD